MPDCIALGFDEEQGLFLPYIMASTASTVVMPLTSQKLLVGTRPGRATPDISRFNYDASECSDEIFIATSSNYANLSEQIGKRWEGNIASIVNDALRDIWDLSPSQNKTTPPTVFGPALGYELTFIGFSKKEEIDYLSIIIPDIVKKTSPRLNLTHLDGITFTSDFDKSISELSNYFSNNAHYEEDPDFIVPRAAALLVTKNGNIMVRIVLDKIFAMSFFGGEVQIKEIALHLIVAGLSIANVVNKIETTLPGFLSQSVNKKDYDGELHLAMRKALRAYRYAYDSANFGANDIFEDFFSNNLAKSLELFRSNILKSKEIHRVDRDHIKLFRASHRAVTEILIDSARLIGHLDGLGKAPLPTPETPAGAAIAAQQLTGWVNAFAYDLQHFWKKESWTRKEIYALNIHVERLLWPYKIFIYPADNGQGTMILSWS
ncbi:hypothetical protein [Pararhodospirillum photometricum]|uniref:hypothetical protein n=1 Tax=Pararhodospirillum photometricum TaxID=1084 RepID=UPI0002FAADE2|nr:hypothetical protein [Pararhodospirillum photometricum]